MCTARLWRSAAACRFEGGAQACTHACVQFVTQAHRCACVSIADRAFSRLCSWEKRCQSGTLHLVQVIMTNEVPMHDGLMAERTILAIRTFWLEQKVAGRQPFLPSFRHASTGHTCKWRTEQVACMSVRTAETRSCCHSRASPALPTNQIQAAPDDQQPLCKWMPRRLGFG